MSSTSIQDDPDVRKEQKITGSIKFSTYTHFFKAANNSLAIIVVFVGFIAAQLSLSSADYFVSDWYKEEILTNYRNSSIQFYYFSSSRINWEEKQLTLTSENGSEFLRSDYFTNGQKRLMIIYTCIIITGTFCYTIRSFAFFRMCLKISINLHDMIFRGVTRTKMRFFQNNPSGRILNRFARDINAVDSILPHTFHDVFEVSYQVFFYFRKKITEIKKK